MSQKHVFYLKKRRIPKKTQKNLKNFKIPHQHLGIEKRLHKWICLFSADRIEYPANREELKGLYEGTGRNN